VHKALKQAYRTKILHLEASIADLRVRVFWWPATQISLADSVAPSLLCVVRTTTLQREGEVTRPLATNATSAVAANIIRGVGVGVGVVQEVKKEPKF
jgi:hypothetical protein